MANLDGRLNRPGATGAGLDTRLTGTLQENQAVLRTLQQQEAPSGLDMLLRPENLAKLGLAAAGALSGDEDLQAVGLGLGLGTMQGAGARAQEAFQTQQERIAKLTNMVEKQQQQLITLLQSQPGLFVDEEGEAVEGATPQQLSIATGLGVELDPAAMIQRARIDEQRQKQWSLYSMEFENAIAAGNEDGAARSLQMLHDAAGIPITFDEAKRGVNLPVDDIPQWLAQRSSYDSIVNSYLWSERNGKPVWHPDNPYKLMEKVSGADLDLDSQNDLWVAEGWGIIRNEVMRLSQSDDPEQRALVTMINEDPSKALELIRPETSDDYLAIRAALQDQYETLGLQSTLKGRIQQVMLQAAADPLKIENMIEYFQTRNGKLTRDQAAGLAVSSMLGSLDTFDTQLAIEQADRRLILNRQPAVTGPTSDEVHGPPAPGDDADNRREPAVPEPESAEAAAAREQELENKINAAREDLEKLLAGDADVPSYLDEDVAIRATRDTLLQMEIELERLRSKIDRRALDVADDAR